MTTHTNPPASGSFADNFNQNAEYTRSKNPRGQYTDTTGMGESIGTENAGQNVAKVQADAQAQGPTMTTSSENTFGGGFEGIAAEGDTVGTGAGPGVGGQRASEAQTSIDSTNAGVDHRRTSYSLTAASLAHANDRFGPEE